MKTYTVGGSIRNEIMGIENNGDVDYVIVGATESDIEKMKEDGYVCVGGLGISFPVYLKDGVEYALARKERSTGPGYHDFEFVFDASVTLEEDLYRRDLTMNAIAKSEDGELIDPYNGIEDIKNGIIRHVSEHFAEDPLRVIRLARFAAVFSDMKVDQSTIELCQKVVDNGMIEHVPYERIIAELYKVISRKGNFVTFKDVMKQTKVNKVLFKSLEHDIFTTKNFNVANRFVDTLADNDKDLLAAILFTGCSADTVNKYRVNNTVTRYLTVINLYMESLFEFNIAINAFSVIASNHIPAHTLNGIVPQIYTNAPRTRPKESRMESNRVVNDENEKIWAACAHINDCVKALVKAPKHGINLLVFLTPLCKAFAEASGTKHPELFRADNFEQVMLRILSKINTSQELKRISHDPEIEGKQKGEMLIAERLRIIRKEMYEWKMQHRKQ